MMSIFGIRKRFVLFTTLALAQPLFLHAEKRAHVTILENTPNILRLQIRFDPVALEQELQFYQAAPVGDDFVPPIHVLLSESRLLVLPPAGGASLSVTPVSNRVFPSSKNARRDDFPSELATLSETGAWRGFRLGRLRVNPIIWRNGELVFAEELTISIKFNSSVQTSPQRLAPKQDKPRQTVIPALHVIPTFHVIPAQAGIQSERRSRDSRLRGNDSERGNDVAGDVAGRLLPEERRFLKNTLNGEIARFWREAPARKNDLRTQSTTLNFRDELARQNAKKKFSGFPSATPFLRIKIRESGFYKLTRAALANAGFELANLNPRTLQLFYRDKEIPLFFNGNGNDVFEENEAFWFYGERLSGENGDWFDDETEVNIYQLLAAEINGLRYRKRSVSDDSQAPRAQYFLQTQHFEQDNNYYHGDDDDDIFTTAKVPGEGWVWTRLLGDRDFTTTIVLPNARAAAPLCSLRARVRGITKDAVTPNHHVRIFLNKTLVADSIFSDTQDIVFRQAFPAALIRGGANDLRVFSVGDTEARIDQVYFDWVEIDYWRDLAAAKNQLKFGASPGETNTSVRYQITNFHQDSIFVFDLENGEILQGFVTTAPGPDQFFITFADSARANQPFFALTPAALRKPLALEFAETTDLRETGRRADMIIISHKNFLDQAQRLAAHRRELNGMIVEVIEVRKIYDAFRFSLPSWKAIRDFLSHAFHNWQAPAPRYVALFGDGSWDPKKNAPGSFKQSFIPTVGNPVSDNRYVCVDGPDDFLPDMFIGRIAVETEAEAAAIVDKIIAYETAPLQDWAKDFVFLNGGVDAFEQNLFLRQSEGLIDGFVQSAPVAGRPVRIYKETEGRFAGELLPKILTALDAGALMMIFSGHAGSQTWELMMVNEDIPRLANTGRLPFIASMTCHTARFGNPEQNSFGEDFLRLPERGSVAFWGTAGWGFAFQDGVLLEGLFQALAQDTVRAVGEAVTRAKYHLWERYGRYANNINIIDQYTLLGDPALTLALPKKPDLAIKNSGIRFDPASPSERDSSVAVEVVVRNRGLATTDSAALDLSAQSVGGGNPFSAAALMNEIGYADTVRFHWPGAARKGEYVVAVNIDAAGAIAEVDELNNRAQKSVYFYSASLSLATPRGMDVLRVSQPVLSVYNPEVSQAAARNIPFEMDSTALFDSPFLLQSGEIPQQPVRTSWQLPRALADGRYFWRSRLREDGNPGVWQVSSFHVDAEQGEFGFWQTGGDWRNAAGDFQQIKSGIALPRDAAGTRVLQVRSGGFFDQSRCDLIIDGEVQNSARRGHNLLMLDPATQEMLVPPIAFDTFLSTAAADSLAELLESAPDGALLMIGVRDDGSVNMTERAHLALETFGGAKTRAVGLRDSWAMLGVKGMEIGAAAEVYKPSKTGLAFASDTLAPFIAEGVVHSPPIGPAHVWKNVSFEKDVLHILGDPGTETFAPNVIPAQAGISTPARGLDSRLRGNDSKMDFGRQSLKKGAENVSISVSGRKTPNASWTILKNDLAESDDLSEIDAQKYPFLRLSAAMNSTDGLTSPLLKNWRVSYEPTGDLALSNQFVELSADTLKPGEKLRIEARLFAFDAWLPDSISVSLNMAENGGDGVEPVAQKRVAVLPNDFSTVAFDWRSSEAGAFDFSLHIDPEGKFADFYAFNNRVTFPVHVLADASAPELEITFDGRMAIDGGLVSDSPEIICHVYDDHPEILRDTSDFNIFIDELRVDLSNPEVKFGIRRFQEEKKKAEIVFKPNLAPGQHTVTFLVNDPTGNRALKSAFVEVAQDLELREVLNYPNPFVNETHFTFTLTLPAEIMRIKIYTVAGRLIRVLRDFDFGVGYNQVYWDGRDADGDALANGIYLYKISARQGDEIVELIQKLAIAK